MSNLERKLENTEVSYGLKELANKETKKLKKASNLGKILSGYCSLWGIGTGIAVASGASLGWFYLPIAVLATSFAYGCNNLYKEYKEDADQINKKLEEGAVDLENNILESKIKLDTNAEIYHLLYSGAFSAGLFAFTLGLTTNTPLLSLGAFLSSLFFYLAYKKDKEYTNTIINTKLEEELRKNKIKQLGR